MVLQSVALLAEGVDRNYFLDEKHQSKEVALLAEGVDRNLSCSWMSFSPSTVALLAEGVDRNSFSQRRSATTTLVALLAEGVDRNLCQFALFILPNSRPPRGGRG